jgi:hypothetical protein
MISIPSKHGRTLRTTFLTCCALAALVLAAMGFVERFLPKEDRFAAWMLYGMVFTTCFNGNVNRGEVHHAGKCTTEFEPLIFHQSLRTP